MIHRYHPRKQILIGPLLPQSHIKGQCRSVAVMKWLAMQPGQHHSRPHHQSRPSRRSQGPWLHRELILQL